MIVETILDRLRGWNRRRIAKRRLQKQPKITPEGFLMVGNPVFFSESWETQTRETFKKKLPSTKRLINIGANAGYYCMMAAKHGVPSIAVEPGEMSLKFLRRNIELNECQHLVRVLPYAISEKSGQATLFGVGTGASLISEKSVAPASVRTTVETKRWTDTGIELNKDDLLIIDVEGMEFEVIQGMLDSLQQHKPRVIIEIDLNRSDATYQTLLSIGYKVSAINENFLFHQDSE